MSFTNIYDADWPGIADLSFIIGILFSIYLGWKLFGVYSTLGRYESGVSIKEIIKEEQESEED